MEFLKNQKRFDFLYGGKSFEELITEFYEWMNGTQPSEAEWKILQEVAKEAGVV